MLGFSALGGLPLGGFQVEDHIAAEVGAFTLTGQDASLVKFVGVVADAGTFTLTGQDANFFRHTLLASTGSFSLVGQDADFRARTIYAVAGSFVISGQSAQLTRTLLADAGAFSLSGQAAGLSASILGGTGAFTLTGQNAGLATSIKANVGAFALSGQSGLKATRVLYPSPDVTAQRVEYLLGGTPLGGAPLGGDPPAQTQATTFVLTGYDAGLERRFTLTADPATYTATFVAADLLFSFRPNNIRAFPRVGRGPRGFGRGSKPIAATSGGGGFKARAFGG
jgi:hypothetical protein